MQQYFSATFQASRCTFVAFLKCERPVRGGRLLFFCLVDSLLLFGDGALLLLWGSPLTSFLDLSLWLHAGTAKSLSHCFLYSFTEVAWSLYARKLRFELILFSCARITHDFPSTLNVRQSEGKSFFMALTLSACGLFLDMLNWLPRPEAEVLGDYERLTCSTMSMICSRTLADYGLNTVLSCSVLWVLVLVTNIKKDSKKCLPP